MTYYYIFVEFKAVKGSRHERILLGLNEERLRNEILTPLKDHKLLLVDNSILTLPKLKR